METTDEEAVCTLPFETLAADLLRFAAIALLGLAAFELPDDATLGLLLGAALELLALLADALGGALPTLGSAGV